MHVINSKRKERIQITVRLSKCNGSLRRSLGSWLKLERALSVAEDSCRLKLASLLRCSC